MWQVIQMNFESLKITAPIVFNQRFELWTLESESRCSCLRDIIKVGDDEKSIIQRE